MKNKIIKIPGVPSVSRHVSFTILVMINVLLLSGVLLLYSETTSAYKKSLREENLRNISNLNSSAAINATLMISNWQCKLDDIVQYVSLHDMSYDEALEFICDANSEDNRYFELIGSNYEGYLAKKDENGEFIKLSYSSSSYAELHTAFNDVDDNNSGDICFAPEFTDNRTALKFFAIYRHLELTNADGEQEIFTLLFAAESSDVLKMINTLNGFDGQSTVLIDSVGNYIVSSPEFKSSNFFQYLYVYNDLSLDEKTDIQNKMISNLGDEIFYKNSGRVVEDCVFRYDRMSANNWYSVTCVPISSFRTSKYNSNAVIYMIAMLVALLVIDITWLMSTNRRLRISVMHEMEANAAKGNFMSRMSHEIRSPLNAVIGYNTIARNEITEASNQAEYRQAEMKVMDCLTKSSIASKHLLTIINDVLDMSAIESGKIKVAHERFDFKGLISSLTAVFYTQANNKGIEFDVVFDTLTEEWFIGDQMRTNQILTNLLSNAIKFTPEGGTVRLCISQPEAETNASHIHFEVSDNGIGMSKEYLEHIWTPFEQADSSISRRFGGTGLGLSITKNLVDLMGGTITAESELDVGTTFGVELTFERTEQPLDTSAYDFSAVNALIVDDDSYTCDYISAMFNRCNARCVSVCSGEEAIRTFKSALSRNDPFSVCLVDWRMPRMNGLETVSHLRKIAGEKLPIIVVTAYDFSEISNEASQCGVDSFISKPLFQSSLFDLLANISGRQAPSKVEKNKKIVFNDKKIILAEDNSMNMEIAKQILESTGLCVDSAWDGKEALTLFEQSPAGKYSAILMDVHMPVMNGHEATRKMRASSHPDAKTIPIIAMTADAFAENVSEAHAAGMNDHISKPIDVSVLFDTLKKYLK